MTGLKIIKEVAAEFGVSPRDLRGKFGRRTLLLARIRAVRRLREERRLTLNQIGRLMGNRTHTTVLHYLSDDRRTKRRGHR